MAMDGDTLGDAMLAAVDAAMASIDQDTFTQDIRTAAFRAMGAAIVAHIQTTAQLTFRTTDAGIQTTTTSTNPTAAPAAPVLLAPGQIS